MNSAWITRTNDELRTNGLGEWRAQVSRGRRTIGMCDYRAKTVYLSKYHLDHDSDSDILDTIYHEVAHALNPYDGHGYKWQKTAKRLGGSGKQYHHLGKTYPSKWETICINGHTPKIFRWDQRTLYTCKCGSSVYIKRSDGTPISLSKEFVDEFNYLASRRDCPLIDQRGLPLI